MNISRFQNPQLDSNAATSTRVASRSLPLVFLLTLLVFACGCKKFESPQFLTAGASGSPPAAAVPEMPASSASVPTRADVKGAVQVSATTGTGTEWAVKQDVIKNDPRGQWASGATASSCFSDCAAREGNSAFQATGVPNVDHESDSDLAWSPKDQDAGIEWLELTFSTPVFAEGVRIRESFNAGAIVKVELYDDQGQPHPVWSGSDPTVGLNYLVLTLPKTAFRTSRLRVTLATNLVAGFNEIDAVQLLGAGK